MPAAKSRNAVKPLNTNDDLFSVGDHCGSEDEDHLRVSMALIRFAQVLHGMLRIRSVGADGRYGKVLPAGVIRGQDTIVP